MSASAPAKKKAAAKRSAKSPAVLDDGRFSDRLIAELAGNTVGAPVMAELHQLSRGQRATVIEVAQEVLPRLAVFEKSLSGITDPENLTSAQVADSARLMADVEDLLAAVAVDSAQFRVWALQADDTQLLGMFARLAGDTVSGEAPSSSS